jgi:hypothetical protein
MLMMIQDVVYKALPRWLKHDGGGSESQADFWALAKSTVLEGTEGIERVSRWMRVLGCSGVDIPWESLASLSDLQASSPVKMESQMDLAVAIGAATHATSSVAFANLVCQVFMSTASEIAHRSSGQAPKEE